MLRLFREQVDLARMTYLEQENKSLTSLLEGQAEQLSRLKLEVARLKEFEQNLRVVSGMDAQTDPAAGAGPGARGKEGPAAQALTTPCGARTSRIREAEIGCMRSESGPTASP